MRRLTSAATSWRPDDMPKYSLMLAAAGLGLCACCDEVSAGSAARYTVDKVWTSDEGLPENSVIAMTQTRDGYLWLGTWKGGLVRFDGIDRKSVV
jgi:hypothetical protein